MFTLASGVLLWAEADWVDASEPIVRAQAIRLEPRMELSRVFFMTRSPSGGQCLELPSPDKAENEEKSCHCWEKFIWDFCFHDVAIRNRRQPELKASY
jgi:hypothetical protein